jgi:hypothetical protein
VTDRGRPDVEAVRISWRQLSPVPDGPPGEVMPLTSLRELGAVRHAVRALLTASLRSGGSADEEALEDVVERSILVIDELASNALRHGAPPATLDLRDAGDHWVVVATDAASDVLPAAAVDRPAGQGGYGLYVVADLTLGHGVEVDGACKRIWALLAKR